jgi:hypothetical protein
MPRFVLLDHDHPFQHWDLMLEEAGVLWTWRLDCPPAPGGVSLAERTFDHRLLYLDYEGPVSGNRGRVVRHDGGDFTWLLRQEGHLRVSLAGVLLAGNLDLLREEGTRWRVAFHPEER